ncbi:MAG: hypothetical protein JKY65_12085 [Planctomycetes bacterium]|nr:hypothetical protein [Planctomycetota bacterium]
MEPNEDPQDPVGSPAEPALPEVVSAEEAPSGPQGPYERPLSEGIRERVPPALARLFQAGDDQRALDRIPSEPGVAGLIPVEWSEEGLLYADSLDGLSPLFSPSRTVPERLEALAAVSLRLEALHETGRVHGDLRPDTIWCASERVELIASKSPLDPADLLRARLIAGAHPGSVGFVAPEVIGGAEASRSSDVYSLAALIVWVLSGRIPLGQFDLRPYVGGLGQGLDRLLTHALAPASGDRPSLARLCDALEGLVDSRAAMAPSRSAPARSSAREPGAREPGAREPAIGAGRGRGPKPPPKISGLLAVVLTLGSAFVFCGLLGLVLATWSGMSPAIQATLLAVITGGSAGIGLLLERRGYAGSGLGFLVLSTQLLWVNGLHLMISSGAKEEPLHFVMLGLVVTSAAVLLAVRRQTILAGVLATAATSVSAIALGVQLSTGSRLGSLFFTAAVGLGFVGLAAVGGLLVPTRRRTLELPYLIGALGWLSASAGAAVVISIKGDGAIDLGWPYVLAILLGVAATRLPDRVANPTWIAVGFMSLFVPIAHAGIAADQGQGLALLLYAAAVGVALGGAGVLLGKLSTRAAPSPEPESEQKRPRRRPKRRPAQPRIQDLKLKGGLAGAWTVASLLWFGVSAFAAIKISSHAASAFDLAWPYLLAAGFLGASVLSKRVATPALVGLCAVLTFVPSAHAAIAEGSVPSLLWVVGVGLGLLALAFRWSRIANNSGLKLGVIAVGLINVLLTPGMACLKNCMGKRGLDLLEDAAAHAGNFNESTLVFLSMPLGTSLGLIGLGFLFSRDAKVKLPYRILEGAGLLNAFGLLTLLSMGDVKNDFFFISLLALGGLGAIAIGVYARRAMFVTISAVALLINLFIQYFAKLTAFGVPWGFLAVGFGIALLILAILYERRIKGFLPQLREWN